MQLSCGRKGRTKHLISPTLKGKEKKTKKIQVLDFETEGLFTLNALQGPFFPFTRAHAFCQLVCRRRHHRRAVR